MYVPSHFEEPRLEVMHRLMRAHPLAAVVILSRDGLNANHIPLYLDTGGGEPYGILRGHVARANPLWRDFDASTGALAIFQGPHSYVSPSWYPGKQEDGRVVPTWNYVTVHAQGSLQIHDDAHWLRAQLASLTQQQEQSFPDPWSIDDAPRDYTDKLLKAVVGIEIRITRLTGKWKISQNQTEENRAGVVRGLESAGEAQGLAGLMKAYSD